jgi:hypothetical protein
MDQESIMQPNRWSVAKAIVGLVIAVGCLRADFIVTDTNPPNGALVQPFSSVTATFNQTIKESSVNLSDFTINGVSANGMTFGAGDTKATFSFSAAAIPSGNRVFNTVDISGFQDTSGDTLTAFTETVVTDSVPPFIVSSSITNGESFPAGFLTDVITFSEPMNTAVTTASAFDLHGVNHDANYSPASFSWDPTATIITINYAIPADQYDMTLFADGFTDFVGNPLSCGSSISSIGCAAEAPVPEPSSVGLFAISLLGIGIVRRWMTS